MTTSTPIAPTAPIVATTVATACIHGVAAHPVKLTVECQTRLPATVIVGMGEAAHEVAVRVREAVQAAGFQWPQRRIVVERHGTAPTTGWSTSHDLAMALAVLVADGQLPADCLAHYLVVGELSMGGDVRDIRGTLAYAALAEKAGLQLMLPDTAAAGNYTKAAPVGSLRGAARLLRGIIPHRSAARPTQHVGWATPVLPRDLADIRGQTKAKRALEVAAAGGHSMLLTGEPGCGKTMIACRLTTILPPMTAEEAGEVACIQDIAGIYSPDVAAERPFRAPHHTVSTLGLRGGGMRTALGEATLAHHGVLFLDEAPEFSRVNLDTVRDLMLRGGSPELPAKFHLVLAANPCPCGSLHACRCQARDVRAYQARLGAIEHHIDIRVRMCAKSRDTLLSAPPGESSAVVRERVVAARKFAVERGEAPSIHIPQELGAEYQPDPWWSGRAARVARTIADLAGSEVIEVDHFREAFELTR